MSPMVLLLYLSTSCSLVLGSGMSLSDAQTVARSIYELNPAPSVVAYVTGGGVQLVPTLLATPGASNSVLDVQIPYSRASLVQLLGKEPKSY